MAFSTPEGVHLILDDSQLSRQLYDDATFRNVMSLGPQFAIAGPKPSETILDEQISIFQYRIAKRVETVLTQDAHRICGNNTERGTKHTKHGKTRMDPNTCRKYVDQFMSKGTWRERFPELEDNIGVMNRRIKESIAAQKTTTNLSKKERACIRKVTRSNEILLINSDKSMGPVAMSKNLFIEECFAHLYDAAGTYALLGQGGEDKTRICEQLHTDTERLLNTIKATQEGRLIASTCGKTALLAAKRGKLASCYIIPKLHKNPIASRLIIPAFDTVAAPLADYLHESLFAEVAKHRYVLRDTNHLIKQLEIANRSGMSAVQCIVTADVTALYPSIKLLHGLEALRSFMCRLNWPASKITTTLRVAEFVLTHNIIEFPLSRDHPIFRQVIGTAMGISFSVCYAIIFMIWFEDPLVREAVEKGFMRESEYWRFIDNLIILWSGPRHALAELMEKMNSKLPEITLTWSSTPEEILQGAFPQRNDFMDLTIWKEESKWKFKIAHKATAAFCYLHPRSCHPRANYKGFIKAEVLRILTHSSSIDLAQAELAFFRKNLIKRGFREQELSSVCEQLKWEDRHEALWQKQEERQIRNTAKIFCTIPFSPYTARIGKELVIHARPEESNKIPMRGTASFCIRSSLRALIRRKIDKKSANTAPP